MQQNRFGAGSAARSARPLRLPPQLVLSCLLERPTDELFRAAFEDGLASIDERARRGGLGGTTGHIAESVVELLLSDMGYTVVWHFAGPGQHGIDLLELAPDGHHVVAVEVKGTLRTGYWPRLTRGELLQFGPDWLDKKDNPGMREWGLESADLYGAIVLVNFADRLWKSVVTADFVSFLPVNEIDELEHPERLWPTS